MLGAIGALFAFGLAKSRAPAPVTAPSFAVAPMSDAGAPIDAAAPTHDAGVPTAPPAAATAQQPVDVVPDGGSASAADRSAAMPIAPEAPIWGPAGALVTVVVFGDLDCPFTRASYATLKRLKQAFGSDLRLVWYDRPIPGHPHAEEAASWVRATEATAGAVAAWRLLDAALLDGAAPDRGALERWTRATGADVERVRAGVVPSSEALAVARSLTGRYDVRRTPTLYVNGLRIEGEVGFAALLAVVRHEFAAGVSLIASGIARSDVYSKRVAKNLIALGPDVPERVCIDPGTSPGRGASSPLVTLVEFCDFGSDGCRSLHTTLGSLAARWPHELYVVYKALPLDSRPGDRVAANLALEARAQGGDAAFWKVHDALLTTRSGLEPGELSRIAGDAGIARDRALAAATGLAHAATVALDERLADQLGVVGVPSCFANGLRIACSGRSADFERAIAVEIAASRALLRQGIDRKRLGAAWCGLP
jgi:protein-disulfide isomerase